jgi:hypothetical protein
LLQAKVANVADCPKGTAGRAPPPYPPTDDARYLADVQATVAAGRLNERASLGLLERLLKRVTSTTARRVLGALSVGSRLLFREITSEPTSKVQASVTRRLVRALPETGAERVGLGVLWVCSWQALAVRAR